ncbi:uncharacterized protein LOC127259476 [Andrographis paniculata]|uniref:uncharacterized protein LOC127259476 n=1 Tax=Andrographis paniculata TaxID=175694 RepID=UPI0021E95648|nr:uncharacterized protein LOC127259476 [Andrographis paniculata]
MSGPTLAMVTIPLTSTSIEPTLASLMANRKVVPTRMQPPSFQAASDQEETSTKKQSSQVPPLAQVVSDSEATASQMGRMPYVTSNSSSPNDEPIATLASAAIASVGGTSARIASDEIVPTDRDTSNAATHNAPEEPIAMVPDAPDLLAEGVLDTADPEAATDQNAAADQDAPDLPAAADPDAADPDAADPARGLLQEQAEIHSSESETSVNLGPRSKPQRPFEAVDESAIEIPITFFLRPTALLVPSMTTICQEVSEIPTTDS